MAFRAKDVQSAQRDDFVVFGFALPSELLVDRLPLVGGHLKNLAFVLEEHHCDRRPSAVAARGICADDRWSRRIGHGQLIFQKMVACHLLGVAAEKNVRAAAGHSDRKSTRLNSSHSSISYA